jgi:hypothetical protein
MMTAKADDRKRLVVPLARPGQVYDVQANADGSITLSPLKVARRVPQFVRTAKRGGYTVGMLDAPIDPAALKAALADFP